jgi:transposase InsO family protein
LVTARGHRHRALHCRTPDGRCWPARRHPLQSGALIEPSVGGVGDSDNTALAETINGLCKAESIHRRGPWRSLEAVAFATPTWVDRFSHRRSPEPIGTIPPAEAEQRYDAMLKEQKLAA